MKTDTLLMKIEFLYKYSPCGKLYTWNIAELSFEINMKFKTHGDVAMNSLSTRCDLRSWHTCKKYWKSFRHQLFIILENFKQYIIHNWRKWNASWIYKCIMICNFYFRCKFHSKMCSYVFCYDLRHIRVRSKE